jgi:hypothetical protein
MAITIGPGISFGPGINFSGSVPPPPAGSAFYSTSGTSYQSHRTCITHIRSITWQ